MSLNRGLRRGPGGERLTPTAAAILAECVEVFDPTVPWRVEAIGADRVIDYQAENYDEIRVTDNFGETELIRVPHTGGGHSGGDARMQDHIFRDPDGPDPYGQRAGLREGAMSALVGIAARNSVKTGEPVRIDSLTSLEPR